MYEKELPYIEQELRCICVCVVCEAIEKAEHDDHVRFYCILTVLFYCYTFLNDEKPLSRRIELISNLLESMTQTLIHFGRAEISPFLWLDGTYIVLI